MLTRRKMIAALPAALAAASVSAFVPVADDDYDRIIADLIARLGGKPQAIVHLAQDVICDAEGQEDMTYAHYDSIEAEMRALVDWAAARCPEGWC